MPSPRSTLDSPDTLSASINRLLTGLRWRIRGYVLGEGLAGATTCLGLAFGLALALDYLPVKFGYQELSHNVRLVMLLGAFAVAGWVFCRIGLRRVFVPLKDQSLALLIERRFPQFNDSLLTTIESFSQSTDPRSSQELLTRTRLVAESQLSQVAPSQIVNSGPLQRSLFVVGCVLLCIITFSLVQPAGFRLAVNRLCLLDDVAWPRRCHLELIGIQVNRENVVEGIEELGQNLMPTDGQFRVAKGSTFTLMVHAEQSADGGNHQLPNACLLNYQTSDGDRGVQTFSRIGSPKDGFQLYALDGQPFRGILTDITFHVRGGDHRIGPFHVNVVDQPDVVETKLDCQFPPYITDESSLRWTDRTIDWVGSAQLPQGTFVRIRGYANKPLKKVYAIDRESNSIRQLPTDGQSFVFNLAPLDQNVTTEFYLCDTDGLVAEQPHRITIDPIEDQPPTVQTRMVGIGTAVTPEVQIPFTGRIDDDYGTARTWIEIAVNDSEMIAEPLQISNDGRLDRTLDFKPGQQELGDLVTLSAGSEATVSLVVKSEDRFDLEAQPNIGTGDRYVLDIVSPDEMMRILERLEIGQRQRLEQIYREMMDARNYLVRTKSTSLRDEGPVEPGDEADNDPARAKALGQPRTPRLQEMRLLFGRRAILQVDKSRQEVLGCASAFESIRLQLINNRIDSEDRKNRLSLQIVAPLRLISEQSMRQLSDQLIQLEQALSSTHSEGTDNQLSAEPNILASHAIEQADVILGELDQVLGVLIKYETQNELLDIVRQMIARQNAIMEQTKKERQRRAFDGLLD